MNNQSENKEGKRSALLSYLKHSLEINSNPALTDSDKEYLIELLSHPVEEKEGLITRLNQIFDNNFNCYAEHSNDETIPAMTKGAFIISVEPFLSALPAPDIKKKLQEGVRELLVELEEYFEGKSDVMEDNVPNKEMRFVLKVREVLKSIKQ